MLTPRLLSDARAAVQRAFHGGEDFSCLTGSCVSGTATTASDVDIVVVLADGIPEAAARAGREVFTREYVRLHRRNGRQPDLRYPGEVLYRRDLVAAVRGRCLSFTDGVPRGWCAESEPYRFWLSMIATGMPLSRPEVFGPAADECADVIVANLGPDAASLAALGLDAEQVTRYPRLARRLRADAESHSPVLACADTSVPILEAHWDHWRRTAALTHRAARDQ